jgi:pilus assembly protein Flp/PilA
MEHIRLMLARLKTDKRAVTALEYGMIAALIAAVVIGAFTTIGTNLNSVLTKIAGSIPG